MSFAPLNAARRLMGTVIARQRVILRLSLTDVDDTSTGRCVRNGRPPRFLPEAAVVLGAARPAALDGEPAGGEGAGAPAPGASSVAVDNAAPRAAAGSAGAVAALGPAAAAEPLPESSTSMGAGPEASMADAAGSRNASSSTGSSYRENVPGVEGVVCARKQPDLLRKCRAKEPF